MAATNLVNGMTVVTRNHADCAPTGVLLVKLGCDGSVSDPAIKLSLAFGRRDVKRLRL